MALFSAARSTSAPIPEVDRRTSRGGGRAARGVSSWFWFRGLCFSVAAWCEEAPDGSSFSYLVASHLPARVAIVGLICAMASVALPASDRRNSTSVISRLARGGCWFCVYRRVRKKSGFFGPTDRGFSSFFILLVVPSFPFQSGSAGRSLRSIRELGNLR